MKTRLVHIVAIAFAVVAIGEPTTLFAQTDGPPEIRLGDVGAGELLRRSDTGWIPLPRLDVEVRVHVSGVMAHGRLTQRFVNPTRDVLEVLYAYPLPASAAVHHMEMRIGDRRIVSEIREREQARRVYAAARDSGRKTALVEQQRANLFTTSAANLNPGESVEIVLEYLEEVECGSRSCRMILPLSFTPRFQPPGNPDDRRSIDTESTGQLVPTFPSADLAVEVHPAFELDTIDSPTHAVDVRADSGHYEVRPRSGRIVADRDFHLEWFPRLGTIPNAAALVERWRDERYAMVRILPPIPGSDAGIGLPTETLFIVDVSGSMNGPSIRQARRALLAALERLRPEDRFNLLKFNDASEVFFGGFANAVPEALEPARQWVRGLSAGGGTMIYPALMRGLALMQESRSSYAQRIVFLTDGAVANEQEMLRAITERVGAVRLHTLGIGAGPNGYLMRKMATLGHGLCDFIAVEEAAENGIAEFLERLDRPVMTDVKIEWDGVEPLETFPAQPPDLHADEPLTVWVRLGDSDGGRVRVSGYTRSGWIESEVELPAPSEEPHGLAVRWARAKVESLMDRLSEGAEPDDVRDAVLDVALDFALVTRYTSLVAVEQVPSALGVARTALPRGGTDRRFRFLIGVVAAGLGLGVLAVTKRRT